MTDEKRLVNEVYIERLEAAMLAAIWFCAAVDSDGFDHPETQRLYQDMNDKIDFWAKWKVAQEVVA